MGEHWFNPVVKWLKEHGGFAKLSLSERKSMRKVAQNKAREDWWDKKIIEITAQKFEDGPNDCILR